MKKSIDVHQIYCTSKIKSLIKYQLVFGIVAYNENIKTWSPFYFLSRAFQTWPSSSSNSIRALMLLSLGLRTNGFVSDQSTLTSKLFRDAIVGS